MSDAWAARTGLTAILITVPGLADYTDRWRSVSHIGARPQVSLAELIPPHVTVLVPWVADPSDGDFRRLEHALSSFEPFDLSFPTAELFDDGLVWLRPEPYDAVCAVQQAVADAFPECPAYGGEIADPVPHLTVASAAQGGPAVLAEVRAALASAPPPVVRLTELTLWREDADGVWRQIGAASL